MSDNSVSSVPWRSSILLADDEPQILHVTGLLLQGRGYKIFTANDGQEALEIYLKERPSIVLSDIRMPKVNGLDLLRRIKEMDKERVAVIMISGHMDFNDSVVALQNGASHYIRKPIDVRELLSTIERCAAELRIIDERDELLRTLETKVAERTLQLEKANSIISSHRNYLQTLIDSIHEPIYAVDKDCNVVFANKASLGLSGQGHLEPGQKCYKLFHRSERPCDASICPYRQIEELKKPVACVHTHIWPDGTPRTVEINASPVFDEKGDLVQIIESCRDITERLKMEEQQKKLKEHLFQQQKEKSIATLAGGIAHDFNNMLMGVIGNAELLKMKLPAGNTEQSHADSIIRAAEQMAGLTRQLMAYARLGNYQPGVVSINEAVHEDLNITRGSRKSNIDIGLDLAEELWPVYADQAQINQAIVNMLINSFESLEAKGGRIRLQTANIENKPAWQCTLGQEHPAGDYIYLYLSDDGCGISPDILPNIFEPFVTTKFMGRGLGLAAVAGIVQLYKGCITAESEPDRGATFHAWLPRYIQKPVSPEPISMPPAAVGRKVLIAEDERLILSLIKTVITGEGFEVLTAADGLEALELFKANRDDIGTVVLDIQMPGMDGKALFREIRALKPDVRVLISSGYEEATALNGIKPDAFMQKPFHLNMLKETIRRLQGKDRTGKKVHS